MENNTDAARSLLPALRRHTLIGVRAALWLGIRMQDWGATM